MLDLVMVHGLLVKAGLDHDDVEECLPYLPMALVEQFHPWDDSYVNELAELVREHLDAWKAGVPSAHLMEALSHGIRPHVGRRVWRMNRTVRDFRTVAAYTHARAIVSLEPTDDADRIDAASEDADVEAWAWLDSNISVTRVVTYIRAGVQPPEALAKYEPLMSSPDTLAGLEMLAGLRLRRDLEDEARWKLH